MKKATVNDLANLSHCPLNKWFDDIDVWPKVKRGIYSLNRLVDFGYLEKKVKVTKDLGTIVKYKVIKPPPAEE